VQHLSPMMKVRQPGREAPKESSSRRKPGLVDEKRNKPPKGRH
jgi:hypothetical protein